MHDSIKTTLASVMIFEESLKEKQGVYLDREDIRENVSFVKKWISKYSEQELDLQLLREVLSYTGVQYRGDLLERYQEKTGEETAIVELQQLSDVRPCRLSRLKDVLDKYDYDYAMEGVVEAYNRMNDRKSAKLSPTEKLGELSSSVRKLYNFINSQEDTFMDTMNLTQEEEDRIAEGAKLTAILWPLSKIHNPLKGVFEKSLNFIAAPQGSYKTKLLVQMAAHNVVGGMNVAYVSAEMDQSEMMGSLVFSILCYTDAWKELYDGKWKRQSESCAMSGSLKQAKLTCPDFYAFVIESLKNYHESGFGRLVVMDTTETPGLVEIIEKLEQIDIDARNQYADDFDGFDAIFLDYLGIFDVPKDIKKKSQDERGEWLAGTCKKRLAMGFCGRGIPVISAHQVNREGQKRVDKKEGGDIKSYDLAGSGWIERYADACVVLRKLQDSRVQIHSVKSRRSADIEPFTCVFNPQSMNLDESISSPVDLALSLAGLNLPE